MGTAGLGAAIEDVLGRKRLAFVGVSRKRSAFSRGLFREFVKREYDVVPVNPQAEEIEGRPCYARVGDIDPAVEWAYVILPKERVADAVNECAEAGITRLWLHGGGSEKEIAPDIRALCEERGLTLIGGQCGHMFLSEAAGFTACTGGS
jgi:uncharacterized protein